MGRRSVAGQCRCEGSVVIYHAFRVNMAIFQSIEHFMRCGVEAFIANLTHLCTNVEEKSVQIDVLALLPC